MKAVHLIASALLLTACGQPAATAPQAETATVVSDQTKPDAAAAPDAAPAVTAQMLVGRWGDNGDCTKDIVFGADGTFRSYTGGGGTWNLNGDVVSMTGQNGTFQVRVAIVNNDTLMIGNPDGSYGMSQRCP